MPLDFALSLSQLNELRTRAVLVPETAAIFQVDGSRALECLQGLLTSDLVAPGEGSLSYGAMLTSKGMIVLDPFVLRDGETFILILPASVREIAKAHFARMLPPRLAKVTDRTGDWEVLGLLGAEVSDRLEQLGNRVPAPGKVSRISGGPALLARGLPLMPFEALLTGPSTAIRALAGQCFGAGMKQGDMASVATARVLAGWPTLGREIDERTFPQEVRFDELGAVSYVKGCYTGQETVARVHFRGHPNRTLRGLAMESGRAPFDRRLVQGGKDVGVIRTAVAFDNRVLALATVKRDVSDEALLASEDREARIVPLPVTQEVPV